MVTLIMEGSVPAEVLGRDVHRRGDVVAVGSEEIPPLRRVVIPQPLRILSLKRNNVGPDVAGVLVDLPDGRGQVNGVLVTEQAVGAGPLGHILHVPRG